MNYDEFKTKLFALLNEFTGENVSAAPATPAGMVAVRPTGVTGAGKVRFWPEVKVVMVMGDDGVEHATGDINYFSYFYRMTRTTNPYDVKGGTYCPPGQYGDALQPVYGTADIPYPEHCDRHMFAGDWMTQDQLDQIARLAERDAGASWGATS